MRTKIVCASAFFLLNICFVTAYSTRNANIVECIAPTIKNLTSSTKDTVDLVKEAINVVNNTVSSLQACISKATSSSSSDGGGQAFKSCLVHLESEVAPQVQEVIKKYKEVIPEFENQVDTVASCLDGAPVSPATTTG